MRFLVAAAVALCLASTAARAHGDAEWIMADPATRYCCGLTDCERAPEGAVKRIAGGWLIVATGQTFMDGDPDLHPAKKPGIWWCRPASMAPKTKCLLTPEAGV